MRRGRLRGWLPALVLCACGAADGGAGPDRPALAGADAGRAPAPPAAGAFLEVGITGESGFRAMPDSREVAMEQGPQGLWMVVLALRGRGFEPGVPADFESGDSPEVRIDAELAGEPVGNVRQRMPFTERDGLLTVDEVFLPFNPDVQPSTVAGFEVAVSARVRDRDGVEAATETTLIPIRE